MRRESVGPATIGAIATLSLITLYFLVLTALNSFGHAVEEFVRWWYWFIPITIGFGIQLGLYSHIKSAMNRKVGTTGIAASCGVSTGSMIACCVHHVTDTLPLIGLSVFALFVSKYQAAFLALGFFSNMVGITIMLNIAQRHKLHGKKFKWLFKHDMKKIRNAVIAVSIVAVGWAFAATAFAGTASAGGKLDLAAAVNNQNTLTIEVKPVGFALGEPVKFSVKLDTHQGALNYDLTKISILYDSGGNTYAPLSWDGPAMSGHHISGTLNFPAIKRDATGMKLVIRNIYNVPERTFSWSW